MAGAVCRDPDSGCQVGSVDEMHPAALLFLFALVIGTLPSLAACIRSTRL